MAGCAKIREESQEMPNAANAGLRRSALTRGLVASLPNFQLPDWDAESVQTA
jgi:hypothetical protein